MQDERMACADCGEDALIVTKDDEVVCHRCFLSRVQAQASAAEAAARRARRWRLEDRPQLRAFVSR